MTETRAVGAAPRPAWDDTWLALADLMAARSRCPSGAGAVIVDAAQRVVATGYAGPPAGMGTHAVVTGPYRSREDPASCAAYCARSATVPEARDPAYRDCPASHAEINCLGFADRTRAEGGTFYVSSAPCFTCAKAIANSGVTRAVWRASEADAYRNPDASVRMLHRSDVMTTIVAPLVDAVVREAALLDDDDEVTSSYRRVRRLGFTQQCYLCRRAMRAGEFASVLGRSVLNPQTDVLVHDACYGAFPALRDGTFLDDGWRVNAQGAQKCAFCPTSLGLGVVMYQVLDAACGRPRRCCQQCYVAQTAPRLTDVDRGRVTGAHTGDA